MLSVIVFFFPLLVIAFKIVHKFWKELSYLAWLDSSQDYTDSTGIDLHEFLVNTLKGNPR